jgi:uncharacterized protein (DUF2062 family)
MTAETIALSVALGLALGVFPVLGCPTLFCALAAVAFRLNLPAIQFVNYLVYPLQLALLIPFFRLGDRIFRLAPGSSRAQQAGGILDMLTPALHATVAWFCVSAPVALLLYLSLIAILRRSKAGASEACLVR